MRGVGVAQADGAEVGQRAGADRAVRLGQPVEHVVVEHHDAAVGGQLQVALDGEIAGDGRLGGAAGVFSMRPAARSW